MSRGTAKFILKKEDIIKIVSKSTVDIIELTPLEKMAKVNSPAVDNYVTIKKAGVDLVEVDDTMIDNQASVGKFAISNDNIIRLIVTKDSIKTLDKAQEEFAGLEITYQLSENIKLDNDKYLLTVYDSNGNLIHPTTKVDLAQATGIIQTLDNTRDITEGGYLIHELKHSFII